MQLSVPKERAPRERRVALVPDAVARLVKAGVQVVVERGAGAESFAADDAYVAAGATIAPDFAACCSGADVVAKVQRPLPEEIGALPEGSTATSTLPLKLACSAGMPSGVSPADPDPATVEITPSGETRRTQYGPPM